MNNLLKVFTFLSISVLVGCSLISKYTGSNKTPVPEGTGDTIGSEQNVDIDTLKKGVVNIRCYITEKTEKKDDTEKKEENGTGFIIDSLDAWLMIITAYHVIEKCEPEIRIKFYEKRTLPAKIGTVVTSDHVNDITLLRVEQGHLKKKEDFHIFHLPSSLPRETDHVRIIGFPASVEWFHSSVQVVSSNEMEIKVISPINDGSNGGLSGGPVIMENEDRGVVGMIKTNRQGIIGVVPSVLLRAFAKENRVNLLEETPTDTTPVTSPVESTMPKTVTATAATVTKTETPTIVTIPETPTITTPMMSPVKCNCGVIKSKLEMSFRLSTEEKHCVTTKCPHLQR